MMVKKAQTWKLNDFLIPCQKEWKTNDHSYQSWGVKHCTLLEIPCLQGFRLWPLLTSCNLWLSWIIDITYCTHQELQMFKPTFKFDFPFLRWARSSGNRGTSDFIPFMFRLPNLHYCSLKKYLPLSYEIIYAQSCLPHSHTTKLLILSLW